MSEKRELERWAVTEFAKLFTAKAGRGKLKLVDLLDPPSPDTQCDLEGVTLFIEVAHVYGTETDAKTALARAGESAPDTARHKSDALLHFGARVIGPLNALLARKATRSYDRRPVWLLVRSGFPLMDLYDFETWYRDEIVVPATHPFDEIWLLCGKTAASGALRLA